MGRDELPDTALLVIEVAQTSHSRDHEKAADYALAGVLEYWIIDLVPALDGVPPVELDVLFGR